jgi:putative MATE family efflux protein
MDKQASSSFYKRLALLALPIIGQDLLNALVNMVDTFMIGSLGETAITAVGLANQLFFVYIMVVFGLSSGSAILMSQYYGMKDFKSIRKTLGIGVCLSAAASFLFAFCALAIPELVMSLYSKDPAVVVEGAKYLRIAGFSYLINAFIVPINTALKSMNMPKYPMYTTAIALSVSVSLNFLFIIILGLGVRGAAVSTLTARVVEICAQMFLIKKAKLPLADNMKDYFSAKREFVQKYIVLAAPVVASAIAWAIGTSMYNVAYKHCGTQAQAGVQIAAAIHNVFWVIGMGIGAASGIILANVLGAGETERAISYSKKIIRIITPVGLFMGLCLVLVAPLIAGLYNVTNEVKEYVRLVTYVLAAIYTLKLNNFTTIVGILRSGGDTLYPAVMELVIVWGVAVPLAFLGAYVLKLPIYWVVLMVQAEDLLKFVTMTPRRLTNRWAKTLV